MTAPADWEYVATERVRVCAVRVATSPLVELRLRWDHTDGVARPVAADRVLAAWLIELVSSHDGVSPTVGQPSAHADAHRLGVAMACWREDWNTLVRIVVDRLATGTITGRHLKIISARTSAEVLHARSALDLIADRECLSKLLGPSTQFSGVADRGSAFEITASEVRATQQYLLTVAPLLVLVGDLNPRTTVEAAATLFDCFSAGKLDAARDRTDTARPNSRSVSHVTTRLDRSACRLAAIVPSRPLRRRTAGDVAAHLLGDPVTGLLTGRLRHQLGYSYDIRCQAQDLGASRVLMCKATVAPRNADHTVAEMRAAVDVKLAELVRDTVTVQEAVAALAAAQTSECASQAGRASQLVKLLAAGIDPDDAMDGAGRVNTLSAHDMQELVGHLLCIDHGSAPAR